MKPVQIPSFMSIGTTGNEESLMHGSNQYVSILYIVVKGLLINFVHKSSFELLRLYTNVWVEPIDIGTLVVKGLNICGRVPSFYRNLCRYQVSCVMVLYIYG